MKMQGKIRSEEEKKKNTLINLTKPKIKKKNQEKDKRKNTNMTKR